MSLIKHFYLYLFSEYYVHLENAIILLYKLGARFCSSDRLLKSLNQIVYKIIKRYQELDHDGGYYGLGEVANGLSEHLEYKKTTKSWCSNIRKFY